MIKPVFRIFDYYKALAFYIDFLGFKIDWEHRPANIPFYLQVSLGDIVIHLTEHHGDCTPGAKAIADMKGLKEYHASLIAKKYKFMNPGLETTPWNEKEITMEVIDPFMNRIVFSEVFD